MTGHTSVTSIHVVTKKFIISSKSLSAVEDSVSNLKLLWSTLVFCIAVYFILDVQQRLWTVICFTVLPLWIAERGREREKIFISFKRNLQNTLLPSKIVLLEIIDQSVKCILNLIKCVNDICYFSFIPCCFLTG